MISEVGYKIYPTMITLWSWWFDANNKHDELARTVLTVLVPTLMLVWYKWTLSYSRNTSATFPVPPGPYGLPVVGYIPFLTPNLHERFTEMAKRYGPIYSLRLGSQLHVVVSSTELVKVVARDMDQTFANRNPTITAIPVSYGRKDIAFSDNNVHWRNMRKLVATKVMSKANLDAWHGSRIHEVRKMVNHVYTKIGTKTNINTLAFVTELKVVETMLWGGSKASYVGQEFQEVELKMVDVLALPNISDFFPMLTRFDLQGREKGMLKHFEYIDRLFDNVIEERMKAISDNSGKIEGLEDGKKDFLQTLIEFKDETNDPKSFDNIHIKALLMDVIVGGTNPTSAMVEWVMTEILNHPNVLIKIQQELTTIIGMNHIIEESHLPKLTYLDAVIKETLRLHTPLPLLIQRTPDEPRVVGGYTVPKDAILYLNVWAIHRDPNNWPDPLEFKPERFLDGRWDYNGNSLKFLPFGLGRRICPGIVMGDKMLMYMLASLLHAFDWSLPEDEEFELSDEFGFVTKKRKPLLAIPSQRLDDANLYSLK